MDIFERVYKYVQELGPEYEGIGLGGYPVEMRLPAGFKIPLKINIMNSKRKNKLYLKKLIKTKLFNKTNILMRKKYGGKKKYAKKYKRRFKRKPRKFRRGRITKKFKRMAYKVERVIGETKYTPYLAKGASVTNIQATSSPTVLFAVDDFPTQGIGETNRIGIRISPIKLIVQLSFVNTITNGSLNPIRVLIFKNTLQNGHIDIQDCFEPGTLDTMYMIARFRPGWGKLLYDFMVQPRIVPENEYNVSTDTIVNVEKKITMSGELYINPNETTEFNKAFIMLYCISSGAKWGTGTNVVCRTKLYYKDA